MGVVIMKSESIFMDRGYPDSRITLYVYCDECGSFDVRPYWSSRRWSVLGASAGLVVVGILAAARPTGAVLWLFPILILFVLPLRRLWGGYEDDSYRCRRCGRVSQANYNTLDYSSDTVHVDVPDQLVVERHWGVGGPESYGVVLDDVLKPPEVPERFTGTRYLRQVVDDLLVLLSLPLLIVGLAITLILGFLMMLFGAMWVDLLSKPFARIFPGKQGR